MPRCRALAMLLLVTACAQDRDGPTPAVAQVMPNLVCNAQLPATLMISGTGFSPAVVDGLSDNPLVVMPRVVFTGGGTTYEVAKENVSLPGGDRTGTKLAALVPVGSLPPKEATAATVVYDLEVTNANGNAGSLANALTVVPPPSASSIMPSSGAQGTQVSVTVMGLAFRDRMTITLDATPPVAATGVVVTSATTATGTFDLTGVAAGVYDVTVKNVEGCSFTLRMAFTVYVPKIIQVSAIDPPFGCTCSTTTVTVTSLAGDFRSTPIVELRPTGMPAATATLLQRVAFVDNNTLTAVVPGGLAIGNYDVTVRNPPYDGGVGTLTSGFRVVANPVPIVTSTEPPGATTQETPTVRILGLNFRSTVKVELIGAASATPVFMRAGLTPVSPTRVDVSIPASTLATAPYLVRVWNEDEQTYFTFSSFLITQPSGKLNAFETLAPQLVTGRRLLAGAAADDSLGNHYVYAIGGEGATGALLDSVEVTALARFGNLGAWRLTGRNHLGSPRTGAAAVTVTTSGGKSYVYVLGGRTSGATPVLGTIERAVVLSSDDAPVIGAATTSSSAGTLMAGTWYYKVAALLPATDADNPGGETLPSDEEIVTLGASGSLSLTWSAVPTAISYRIYRTDAVNGRSQQEHLVGTATGTTFTDDGKAAGSEDFLPDGALGAWKAAGSLGTARWGHQALLARDPSGAAHVVVLGGKSAVMGGVLASVEHAPVDAATGALGAWSGGTAMPEPRAFFWAADGTQGNSKLKPPTATRIFVTAGVNASSTTLDTVTFSDVGNGGGNSAWTTFSKSTNSNVGGVMSVITNNTLFMMGGAGAVGDGSGGPTISGITASGRQMILDNDGAEGSSISSTSSSLLAPRAFGVVVRGAGLIYFIGGTSSGNDALRSTEKTF